MDSPAVKAEASRLLRRIKNSYSTELSDLTLYKVAIRSAAYLAISTHMCFPENVAARTAAKLVALFLADEMESKTGIEFNWEGLLP